MINLNNLMARIEQKKKEFARNDKPVTPKQGITKLVVLQGWRPEAREVFWHEFGGHYIKDSSGKTVAFYPCDMAIFGNECPVCSALQKASSMTNDEDQLRAIKEMRAGTQYLINAIVVGENDNKPVVFSLPKRAFTQLLTTMQSWGQAIFDEANPQIVIIQREGTGFDTNYTATVTPEKFTLPANTYSQIKNLDEYVNQRTDALANRAVGAIATTLGVSSAMIETALPPVQQAPQIATQPVAQPAVAPAVQPQPAVAQAQPAAQPAAQTAWEDLPNTGKSEAFGIDAEVDQLLASLV